MPYIIGLGKAAELAGTRMDDENTRVRALRDKLEKGLMEQDSQLDSQWRRTGQASQHLQRQLLNMLKVNRSCCSCSNLENLCLIGFGLHVRLAGALSCSQSHGSSFHGRARLHPVLFELLQHGKTK